MPHRRQGRPPDSSQHLLLLFCPYSHQIILHLLQTRLFKDELPHDGLDFCLRSLVARSGKVGLISSSSRQSILENCHFTHEASFPCKFIGTNKHKHK